VLRHAGAGTIPLHVPGHKGGRGLDRELSPWLARAAQLDLTELDGLDSLHAPQGPLAEAQALAATLWQADQTFFLVGGSTVGIQAMILASCQPGDAVLLPRDAHMSAMGGLILAGARPVYAPSTPLGDGLWGAPDLAMLSAALAHHRPRAVLLTRPSYEGRLFDLAPYADAVHAAGAVLLVDEAHGAHLGLHPRLPATALAQGADAAVQSTHKMLGALTPGAMLHLKGDRLEGGRVHRALSLLQTTSPSYLVLASLDAARRHAAEADPRRWDTLLDRAAQARTRLGALPGLRVLDGGDPLKIALDVAGAGMDGYAAVDRLAERGVIIEHATHRHVVAFLGPGTRAADLSALVAACEALAPRHDLPSHPPHPPSAALPLADPLMPPIPPMAMLPREAFFAASRPVPWESAVGAVSAELVCPYPPGAPTLVPGERITAEVVEYLDGLRSLGAQIAGPVDPTLSTIRIMA
jgi:arginine/lysine/ornithine decarboxylase